MSVNETLGAFVVNEPQGSPGWFPANDGPNDKALYDFAITVPAGNVAAEGFIALSERESGQDLDAFFQAWLSTPEKPASR